MWWVLICVDDGQRDGGDGDTGISVEMEGFIYGHIDTHTDVHTGMMHHL